MYNFDWMFLETLIANVSLNYQNFLLLKKYKWSKTKLISSVIYELYFLWLLPAFCWSLYHGHEKFISNLSNVSNRLRTIHISSAKLHKRIISQLHIKIALKNFSYNLIKHSVSINKQKHLKCLVASLSISLKRN